MDREEQSVMGKIEFELTKGEEFVMEFFWNADGPLTTMQVSHMTEQFNDCYIHRLVKSLEKKGMLNVCGFQKSGKQYARQFLPTVTREEYGAVLMEKIGIQGKRSLAKVVTAMIRRPDSNEIKSTDELIRELEMIIEELKEG